MNSATLTALTALREGRSAAEVAALLAADPYLQGKIELKTLSPYLITRGLSARLVATQDLLAQPGYEAWFELLAGLQLLAEFRAEPRNEYLSTSTADPDAETMAPKIDGALTALVTLRSLTENSAVGLTQDEADAIRAIGGGYRYERLTAAEITAAWHAADRQEALGVIRQRAGAAYSELAEYLLALSPEEQLPDDAALTTRFAARLEG